MAKVATKAISTPKITSVMPTSLLCNFGKYSLDRRLFDRHLFDRRLSPTPPKDTPKALLPYLCHHGSLTKALEQLGGERLQVHLDFTGFCPLMRDNKRQMAWVRQVTLGAGDKAWVQGKTVIFASELRGATRRLQFIKARPIGYVLFKRQRTLPFERWFFKIENGHQKAYFGRQTMYHWQGTKVVVEEVFLPTFLAYLSND